MRDPEKWEPVFGEEYAQTSTLQYSTAATTFMSVFAALNAICSAT